MPAGAVVFLRCGYRLCGQSPSVSSQPREACSEEEDGGGLGDFRTLLCEFKSEVESSLDMGTTLFDDFYSDIKDR